MTSVHSETLLPDVATIDSFSDDSSLTDHRKRCCRIPKCKRTIVVEPVLILFVLCSYPMSIISQQFIYHKISNATSNYSLIPENLSVCHRDNSTEDEWAYELTEQIQQRSTYFGIFQSVASSVPAMFVVVFLGAFSDKAGRKYAIVAPLVGMCLQAFTFLIVIYLDLPIVYLLIGSFLNGLCGMFQTLIMACMAYIADTTTPERRMFRIIILEMSMLLSALLTPIGISYWIESSGYLYPFLWVFGGYLLALLYAIFLVPETVERDPKARFFSTEHIRFAANVLTRKDVPDVSRPKKLALLFLAVGFVMFVVMGNFNVGSLYEMNKPLCWDVVMIGYFTVVDIITITVGGTVLVKLLKCCGTSDMTIAVLCCLSAVAGNVYKGMVASTLMMFFVPLITILGMIFLPTLRSTISILVEPNEQGAVFGVIAFLEISCGLVGSILINVVYAATVTVWTGFVWFIVAVFYLASLIVLATYMVLFRKDKELLAYKHLDSVESVNQYDDTMRTD